jgi:heme/copper-type cytochrome/quinol oxidase subunit 2
MIISKLSCQNQPYAEKNELKSQIIMIIIIIIIIIITVIMTL